MTSLTIPLINSTKYPTPFAPDEFDSKKIILRIDGVYYSANTFNHIEEEAVVVEYLLITTLSNWSSKRIIKQYKKRQTIENVFKDFNQSFSAQKLPTHAIYGNAFYFQMVTLASSVSFFLKHTLLTKKFHSATLDTLRHKFMSVPGEFEVSLQDMQICLKNDVPFLAQISRILQKK